LTGRGERVRDASVRSESRRVPTPLRIPFGTNLARPGACQDANGHQTIALALPRSSVNLSDSGGTEAGSVVLPWQPKPAGSRGDISRSRPHPQERLPRRHSRSLCVRDRLTDRTPHVKMLSVYQPSTRTGRNYRDSRVLRRTRCASEDERSGLSGRRGTPRASIERLPKPRALVRFRSGAFPRGGFRSGFCGFCRPNVLPRIGCRLPAVDRQHDAYPYQSQLDPHPPSPRASVMRRSTR